MTFWPIGWKITSLGIVRPWPTTRYFTGLTAAYLLKLAGKKVAVLERERIAAVDSGHTTAHLTAVMDLPLTNLVKRFGSDAALLTWQAGTAAINSIEELVRLLNIDCDFRRIPGYLHASLDGDKDENQQLAAEAAAARELAIEAEFVEAVSYFNKPGVCFPNQAKFHPVKYLAALAKAFHGDGCTIFENSSVSEISDEPFAAVANGRSVKCDYLVIATHVPLTGTTGPVSATLFQSKLSPYTSYVVGGTLPNGTVPEASYWDTTDPYYYLRVDAGSKADYFVFGGKDHKTGQEEDTERRFTDLQSRLRELIPAATPERQWSGQVIETNDGLPYIGETAERQFVATGFAGNGMTFGTLAGMMACDIVVGRDNPWQKLFSVERTALRGGVWNYVRENLDYPYYLIRDRLSKVADSTRAVKRGEGQIVELDGDKIACSRDEYGKLSKVSAVCTHMGCLVQWNGAERTWDCPCHGSRFHATGEVLAGPAETPLVPMANTARSKTNASSARRKKPSGPAPRKHKTQPNSASRKSH